MSTKQKNGMAALEEFLQERYVEGYEEFDSDKLKVENMQVKYPQYFYIPKNENIGGLNYIVDSSGNSLYLIKKSGLPRGNKRTISRWRCW